MHNKKSSAPPPAAQRCALGAAAMSKARFASDLQREAKEHSGDVAGVPLPPHTSGRVPYVDTVTSIIFATTATGASVALDSASGSPYMFGLQYSGVIFASMASSAGSLLTGAEAKASSAAIGSLPPGGCLFGR